MAHDHDLAQRVRDLLADEPDVSEKLMFGGLAFLLAGHMAVTCTGRGGLMVRVAPQRGTELAAAGTATQVEMHGRPMKGWLHIAGPELATDRELTRWVNYAREFARTLPAKA